MREYRWKTGLCYTAVTLFVGFGLGMFIYRGVRMMLGLPW